ncbi:Uncharacterised protein [Yersinia intermedia]|nr:Uncharacterised protein [Yersinia intermedia]
MVQLFVFIEFFKYIVFIYSGLLMSFTFSYMIDAITESIKIIL